MAAAQHDLGGREAGPWLQQVHQVRGALVPHPRRDLAHLHQGLCHEVSLSHCDFNLTSICLQELVSTSRQFAGDKMLCS